MGGFGNAQRNAVTAAAIAITLTRRIAEPGRTEQPFRRGKMAATGPGRADHIGASVRDYLPCFAWFGAPLWSNARAAVRMFIHRRPRCELTHLPPTGCPSDALGQEEQLVMGVAGDRSCRRGGGEGEGQWRDRGHDGWDAELAEAPAG
jgi:hypothetical protein